MTMLSFKAFRGEVPRLAAYELPPDAAQLSISVDLQHGEIRGLRGNAVFAQTTIAGGAIKTVYTDDGVNFFAWPYEVYPVKSMVVGEIYYRVYYTANEPYTSGAYPGGNIIKVARTRRADGTASPPLVIGSATVGGNFQPPENSNVVTGNNLGPDSWVLGVPAAAVGGATPADNLVATLVDKPAWPYIPRLQLRVTYFLETNTGQIVYQQDISNNENPDPTIYALNYSNVFWTNENATTGNFRYNKIQDMLFPFGNQQKPYKYYWFQPPTQAGYALVPVTNTGIGDIVITYSGSPPVFGAAPSPGNYGNFSTGDA